MKNSSPLSHGAGISRGLLHYLESSDFFLRTSNPASLWLPPQATFLSLVLDQHHHLFSGPGSCSPTLSPRHPSPHCHSTTQSQPVLSFGPRVLLGRLSMALQRGPGWAKVTPCECHSCSTLTRCLWKWFLLNCSEFELTRKVSFRNTTSGWGRWSEGGGWG